MGKRRVSIGQIGTWQKYAPPLPNELGCLEEAFYALVPIVNFCAHLGSKAKLLAECTHEEHRAGACSWECRCCQSRRFRSIFGSYIDFLCPQLPTELTGTKIKHRAYRFGRRTELLYFRVRRHPRLDYEWNELEYDA